MSNYRGVPHDRADLYLAPVVLKLDSWLEDWSDVSEQDILVRIAVATNEEPRDVSERKRALVHVVEHDVELHGWAVDFAERGVRMRHGENQVVLGLPASLREFLTA